ncbi:MAG: hypothetical protein AAB530_00810 [Patescibacteria group bacterium]
MSDANAGIGEIILAGKSKIDFNIGNVELAVNFDADVDLRLGSNVILFGLIIS